MNNVDFLSLKAGDRIYNKVTGDHYSIVKKISNDAYEICYQSKMGLREYIFDDMMSVYEKEVSQR